MDRTSRRDGSSRVPAEVLRYARPTRGKGRARYGENRLTFHGQRVVLSPHGRCARPRQRGEGTRGFRHANTRAAS